MAQCPYRRQEHECGLDKSVLNVSFCERCLRAQLADEISLNTRAIMSMSMNKMEEEADGN